MHVHICNIFHVCPLMIFNPFPKQISPTSMHFIKLLQGSILLQRFFTSTVLSSTAKQLSSCVRPQRWSVRKIQNLLSHTYFVLCSKKGSRRTVTWSFPNSPYTTIKIRHCSSYQSLRSNCVLITPFRKQQMVQQMCAYWKSRAFVRAGISIYSYKNPSG